MEELNVIEVTKYPEWKQLVSVAVNWEYNSIHTHEEISDILMLKVNSGKYRSSITKAKSELEKMGKALKSLHGHGYIVMEANEYLSESTRYSKKSKNNARRAVEVLTHTPLELLTPEQQKIRELMLDSGLRMVAVTEGGFKEIKTLEKNVLRLNSAKG